MTEHPHGHWFETLADHMGEAYLRYSFTKGTDQEIDFLVRELELSAGSRVLDVGCGPGRHTNALGALGIECVGVDISHAFCAVGARADQPHTQFVRGDATQLGIRTGFDVAISLCQGGFGLPGDTDRSIDPFNIDIERCVLSELVRVLKPGGRVALSAFSSYFQVAWLEDNDDFDAQRAINCESTTVMNAHGEPLEGSLWTTCYTPRELFLLCESVGMVVDNLYSVAPGDYQRRPANLTHQEFLVIGHRGA